MHKARAALFTRCRTEVSSPILEIDDWIGYSLKSF